MKAIEFTIKLTTAFTDSQLVKGGWSVVEKEKLYTREKGNYKFSYIIRSFGKIRISEMKGELTGPEKLALEQKNEFEFCDAWKILWNKSFEPQSVEILMKDNLFQRLIELGWKPAVIGVIENTQESNDLSYYYPAPEGENLYKLVDDNPGDVMTYAEKLRKLNLI